MKKFADKLINRNYTKRIIAIIIAALVLLAAVAILIPVTLHKQISEAKALWEEYESKEKQEEQQKGNTETAKDAEDTEDTDNPENPENTENVENNGEEKDDEVKEDGKHNSRKRDDKEHEIKAILKQLTPVGKGTKIAFAAVFMLAFLLGVFYWITVVEWLYKTAVRHGLNRALWPILGCIFNILVIPVLLIVICDPKRAKRDL